MAYDPEIAERLRAVVPQYLLKEGEVITETKMFGGICFTLNGKMLIGIDKSRLVVRLTTEDYEEQNAKGRALPMDLTGRPLRNFAYLVDDAWQTDEELLDWIDKSTKYVREFMLGKPSPKRKKK